MSSSSELPLLENINQTITNINRISGSDWYVDSFLAQFLVVYICGMYEQTIEDIFIDFVKRNSSREEIVAYASNTINRNFRNPEWSNLKVLMNNLGNESWGVDLSNMFVERDALDSIVANKNNLAHGRGSVVTLRDVFEWYPLSRELIGKFRHLLSS